MAELAAPRCRVGADIGGTFTDVVCQTDDGRIVTRKVASTTGDYSRAIVEALVDVLAELELRPEAVSEVIHGSTVATNAILEGKGARTALITTRGFRDVLELQRIRIPELYNLFYEKPVPLVPRRLRFEVTERLGPGGVVWERLNATSVEAALEQIADLDVEAVAICLLHSYADPGHEQVVADAARAKLPEVFVTRSSEVLAELREYERTSTTVINAYVGPPVRRYIQALERRLRDAGVHAPLLIMQCGGGIMTGEAATIRPAYIVESGPAAGVTGAAVLAAEAGIQRAITLDMGGTTAKASTVIDGAVAHTSEYEVGAGINLSSLLVKGGGYALKIPVIDVSEIGAGGGSIVSVDADGRLLVGPESAGAVPGPVCYGGGGVRATVTDAHVVLGFVNPRQLAGGAVKIRRDLALRAITEQVAEPLGLDVLEAAYGVHAVAVSTMTRAVKAVTTYRGRDPREFTLLAFGGNGPVVGADLAQSLRMRDVLVPPSAGLLSAHGLLRAKLESQVTKTYIRRADPRLVAELEAAFRTLEREVVDELASQVGSSRDIRVRRSADMRYEEQGYELQVPVAEGPLSEPAIEALIEAFHQEHLRTYGHRAYDEPVDIVNVRVAAEVASEGRWPTRGQLLAVPSASTVRTVYFGSAGLHETRVTTRAALAGVEGGPLLIEDFDTSTVVPPGATVELDDRHNLRLSLAS